MTEPVNVDAWSDVQCPWCYIGKRRLDAAIASYDRPVSVTYHAFDIAPDMPVDVAETAVELLSQRKGLPAAGLERGLTEFARMGRREGLDYRFDRMQPTSSALAHQLIQYARHNGRQAEMVELLFKAFFTHRAHIGHAGSLTDVAAAGGFDRREVADALRSGVYAADVRADLDLARSIGVTAVPSYVVDGRYAIAGAQEADVFRDVLRKASLETAGAGTR